MKKILNLILVFTIFITIVLTKPVTHASYNSSIDVEAKIVLLVSMDDGTVIFDKNADMRNAPASLTKIVTAILTLRHCADLEEEIEVPNYAIRLLDGTNSSNVGLLPGEKMSIKNLLYCMLVASANDAANVLADHVSGGNIVEFINEMNKFVSDIGCEDTVFANAHGLDAEGQYTTANDMLKIVKAALRFPVFEEITSTRRYTIEPTNKYTSYRYLVSTNGLLNPGIADYYYEYAKGVKTGSTAQAGRCVISTASRDGYSYLAIIMNAPFYDIDNDGVNENIAFMECRELFAWTFKNIRLRVVAEPSQVVTVIDVELSSKLDHVRLIPSSEVTALVPTGADSEGVYFEIIDEKTPSSIDAPVEKGEVIGKARILYAGEEVATVDLVAGEDIQLSLILYFGRLIKNIVSSLVFLIIFGLLALLIVSYIILKVYADRKRRRIRIVKGYRELK